MSAMAFGQSYPQFQAADGQDSVSIYEYMMDRIHGPEENPDCYLPGTEVIAFVVTSSGTLTDFRIVNSISGHMDEEMIRILKATSGSWNPGRINGKPVDMEHEVALKFVPYDFDPVQAATKYLSEGNKLIYKNPKRALRYINKAFRLFPCSKNVLTARIVCKAELGNIRGAKEDCHRITILRRFVDYPHEVQVQKISKRNN